jgi:hypothetical protein
VNFITAGWQAYGLKYERYRTHAIYDTSDPETIIVEQEVLGTSAATGEFALPNIVVVLTACNGQIIRLRDYVSIPAAAAAMGRDIAEYRAVRRSHHRISIHSTIQKPGRGLLDSGRGEPAGIIYCYR